MVSLPSGFLDEFVAFLLMDTKMSSSATKAPIEANQVSWQPVNCAFCGGGTTRFFNHEGWPWPTEYVRCVACRLIYLQPRPKLDAVVLHHLYENAAPLVNEYANPDQVSVESIEPKHWRRYADSLDCICAAHPQPGVLVDVGTGNGLLMILAKRRGWQAIGIDVSESRARVCQQNFGLDVRAGTLETVHLPADSADAVAMRHVLEHVEDPIGLLSECRRVLRPGGILLVEVPNPESIELVFRRFLYRLKLHRRKWQGNLMPWHLFEFPPVCLAKKAVELGFSVVRSCSYSHSDLHNPVALLALRAYHHFGIGTKTRLVLRKQ